MSETCQGIRNQLVVNVRLVGDKVTIVGSFAQVNRFPHAVDYLCSGKVRVDGILSQTSPD